MDRKTICDERAEHDNEHIVKFVSLELAFLLLLRGRGLNAAGRYLIALTKVKQWFMGYLKRAASRKASTEDDYITAQWW